MQKSEKMFWEAEKRPRIRGNDQHGALWLSGVNTTAVVKPTSRAEEIYV
jgi:hypothetical protein